MAKMMTNYHQHGLDRSMIIHLRERFPDVEVDLVFDGYELAEERPLITAEQMQSNNEIISKGREAVETIYRYQIGLHDSDSVNLSIMQERLQNVFLFDEFTFYNTLEDSEASGSFLCELLAVTPVRPEVISDKTAYNRIYLDVEIQTIKRRC